jgi:hypothetical protein
VWFSASWLEMMNYRNYPSTQSALATAEVLPVSEQCLLFYWCQLWSRVSQVLYPCLYIQGRTINTLRWSHTARKFWFQIWMLWEEGTVWMTDSLSKSSVIHQLKCLCLGDTVSKICYWDVKLPGTFWKVSLVLQNYWRFHCQRNAKMYMLFPTSLVLQCV